MDDLRPYGVEEPGEPVDQGVGEPGCSFDAENFLLTVYKSPEDGIVYWEGQRGNFSVFERNQVGPRAGIKGIERGAQGSGACVQIMEAAGGSVSVDVMYDSDQMAGKDPCAKAMEFAKVIEPRLPE